MNRPAAAHAEPNPTVFGPGQKTDQTGGRGASRRHRTRVEPCAKRVRAVFNGEVVADSTAVRYLFEEGRLPVYYFPRADVRLDLTTRSDHSSHCPHKGEASYWSLDVGGRVAENALWSYETPHEVADGIRDHMALAWEAMDHWYEEDEEVYVHARDPYVRIDVLASQREVTVQLGGETLAQSRRALFLFETGLPVRYYLPRADVRTAALEATHSQSACPYKGTAGYFTANVGSRRFEDIVWTYSDPLPECASIKDHLCFYNERVDAILIDGVEQPKVKTKWSRET